MSETAAAQDTRPEEDAVALVRACLSGDATAVGRVVEHCDDPARAAARTAEIATSLIRVLAGPRVLVDPADLRLIVGTVLSNWPGAGPVPDALTRLLAAAVTEPPGADALLAAAASVIAPDLAPVAVPAGGSDA